MQSQAADSLRIPRCWHRCCRRALINDTGITLEYPKADRRTLQLALPKQPLRPGLSIWPATAMSMPRKTAKTSGQFRVHVLYKRPEIPAHEVVPAIAVSVTYRKHENAENPGSIPASATARPSECTRRPAIREGPGTFFGLRPSTGQRSKRWWN